MSDETILIVEDNPNDEVLILRALKKSNVGNKTVVVRDGAEALDCLFGTGAYEGRDAVKPAVVLLDLNSPASLIAAMSPELEALTSECG